MVLSRVNIFISSNSRDDLQRVNIRGNLLLSVVTESLARCEQPVADFKSGERVEHIVIHGKQAFLEASFEVVLDNR